MKSKLNEIDIESILSHEAVIAQQDFICGKIGAPTTIILFPYRKNGNADWVRLDSQVSAITLRTSCDLLRRCCNNGGELCLNCDKRHAGLFREMSYAKIAAGELENQILEKQKEWNNIYHNPPHYDPHIEKKDGRIFLSYNCPMLGYRELIFPIFFEEKVVAVFFNGQIKLVEHETEINENKKNFFRHNLGIFDAYIEECKKLDDYKVNPDKYTSKAIEKYIFANSRREINPDYPEVYNLEQGLQIPVVEDQLSQERYDTMLGNICEWLDDLENMLVKEIRRKRENYTRYVFSKALSGFHADSADASSTLSIRKTLWNPVEKFTKKIAEKCMLEYIAVYGVQSIGRKAVTMFKMVTLSNSDFSSIVPTSFSLQDSPVDFIMDKPSDNRTAPVLFNALSPIPPDNEQTQMNLVFQPMKEISAASVAILVKYSGNTLKESIEDALISGLKNLTALISLRLAVRFVNVTQHSLKNILRLYKHEMVNLTSDISRAIHDYLGNPKLKGEIDQQKINDVYRDATSTLTMFEFLSKNIGILTDDPIPPEKRNVSIYHNLLYKWENNKRMDARDKGCDFEFHKSHINIYTDPRYLEIVVYNLLTNAVKYAYDNTMIYMHCERPRLQDNYVLSITNFTFIIEAEVRKKIFDIGYRTRKARDYYPEGNGIGLGLVRRVMEILEGNVKLCEPELISSYNVPLLYAYVNNSDFYASAGSTKELEEAKVEYIRLSKEHIFNDLGVFQDKMSWVISKRNWHNPPKSLVQAELHNATYMIRFEVNFYE